MTSKYICLNDVEKKDLCNLMVYILRYFKLRLSELTEFIEIFKKSEFVSRTQLLTTNVCVKIQKGLRKKV